MVEEEKGIPRIDWASDEKTFGGLSFNANTMQKWSFSWIVFLLMTKNGFFWKHEEFSAPIG